MKYCYSLALLATVSFICFAPHAAMAKKNKGPDPILKKAIEDSAKIEPMPLEEEDALLIQEPEPAPVEEVVAEPMAEPVDDGPGYKVGMFRFLPALGLQSGFDSNIYTTNTDEESGYFMQVLPSLEIDLEDSDHDLTLSASYDYKEFIDEPQEDRRNYSVALDGRARLNDMIAFPVHASWTESHEEREDDLLLQIPDEPIGYEVLRLGGGVEVKPGRLGLKALADYTDTSYDDGTARAGGASIIRSDADHDIIAGIGEISFDVTDSITPYIAGRYAERDYDRNNFQSGSFSGPNRSSDEWNAVIGTRFTFKSLKTDIFVGYTDFDYDDDAISDVTDIIAGLDLSWDLTQTMNLGIGFNRYVFEDDEVVTPIIRTRLDAQLTELYQENWLVSFGGGYELYDFESSSREDDVFDIGVGVDYLINDRISIGGMYEYQDRESDITGLDFDRHIAMVRINGKL